MQTRMGGSWVSRVSGIAIAFGLALAPLAARTQQVDATSARRVVSTATLKPFTDAIEALGEKRFDRAKAAVEKLDFDTLSPYERSKVEQILFNVAYEQGDMAAARQHLLQAIDAGGLDETELEDIRRQIARIDGVPSTETRAARRLATPFPQFRINVGLAQMTYVVGIDGKISRVVLEDAVGPGARQLERDTREALSRWTFEPATLRGEPVATAGGLATYSYASGEDKVSSDFAKRYKHASELLAAGELEKTSEALDELLDRLRNSREFVNFSLLEAQFATATGDQPRQYRAIARAVRHSSFGELTPAQEYQALQMKFGLEARMNQVADALSTYESIKEHRLYPVEPNDAIETVAARFEAARQSGPAIVVDAAIEPLESEDGPVWRYRLLRRRIAISDVSGDLRSIEFLCSKNHTVEAFSGAKTWDLPEDWGNCALYAFGAAGTTFRLTEPARD
jgi:hypothetical protein